MQGSQTAMQISKQEESLEIWFIMGKKTISNRTIKVVKNAFSLCPNVS